jgi:hypothetical protein
LPVVLSYGGPDEFSLQQRQLTYQPTRGAWSPAAPRGLRPIRGNVFGGSPFGAQPPGYRIGGGVGGYSDILAAQRLWSSFVSGMNGGSFAQR